MRLATRTSTVYKLLTCQPVFLTFPNYAYLVFHEFNAFLFKTIGRWLYIWGKFSFWFCSNIDRKRGRLHKNDETQTLHRYSPCEKLQHTWHSQVKGKYSHKNDIWRVCYLKTMSALLPHPHAWETAFLLMLKFGQLKIKPINHIKTNLVMIFCIEMASFLKRVYVARREPIGDAILVIWILTHRFNNKYHVLIIRSAFWQGVTPRSLLIRQYQAK